MSEEPGLTLITEEKELPTAGALFAGITTPNVDFSEILLEEKVGHGSYGVVYKAVWHDRLVAVKEFGDSADQKAIETEVKQLSRVSHTNIIALFGISSDQQSKYLIMEYAEGGSLHNFLHGKVQPAYSRAHAMSWARQCAEGVAYLHAMLPKPLIHRDLKPLNLLLTNKGRHLKICDFGTVADKSTMMTNNRGSAAWMAPEVFEGINYTEKCDIFSWAIVLWEVLSRKQPFKEIDNTYSIMWKIHKGERPPLLHNCPLPIEELMTSCWKTAPEERPSMKYVVQVMNEIAAAYPGADQPLEYRFINQQIVTDDSLPTDEQYNSRLYTSDSSTNSNQTQMTPTDVQNNTNTSGASTPTNCTGASSNGDGTESVAYGNNGLFQPRSHASSVPQVSIVSTNRWEAIPEEESDINTYETNNGSVDSNYDSFKLTPSAEAAKRFDTIRNVMINGAPNPMNPLKLDVEPHAFDLSSSECSNNVAKTNGKERLAVSDVKIMPPPTTTAVPYKLQQSTMSDMTNNNNTNTNTNNTNNNNKVTDDNDDTDQSLTEILDAELQPEPPIPNNPESQAIYREHRRLAKEYLSIETDLYYAQDLKEKLILQMDVPERLQKQELLLKIKDKESLVYFYNNLKQQIEKMRADDGASDINVLPHSHMQNLQPAAANDVLLSNANSPNTSGSLPTNSENLSDDGWVVITSNQNT